MHWKLVLLQHCVTRATTSPSSAGHPMSPLSELQICHSGYFISPELHHGHFVWLPSTEGRILKAGLIYLRVLKRKGSIPCCHTVALSPRVKRGRRLQQPLLSMTVSLQPRWTLPLCPLGFAWGKSQRSMTVTILSLLLQWQEPGSGHWRHLALQTVLR